MIRRAAAVMLASAATLAGCGGDTPHSPTSPTHVQRASGTGLRFVKPPFIVAIRGSGTVRVWVRLNRPLRRNGRYPGEYADFNAFLDVPGTRDDLRGLYRISKRATCYGELLGDLPAGGNIDDGERLKVSLVLRDDIRITATAKAHVWKPVASIDERAARHLHCRHR